MSSSHLICPPRQSWEDDASQGMFHDYTWWTVCVIMAQSVGGYLIGALFKHIDAIAAIYAARTPV